MVTEFRAALRVYIEVIRNGKMDVEKINNREYESFFLVAVTVVVGVEALGFSYRVCEGISVNRISCDRIYA